LWLYLQMKFLDHFGVAMAKALSSRSATLLVAAFGVPVAAAIAATKVHADMHVLRRGRE
jgi:hypothetical protein